MRFKAAVLTVGLLALSAASAGAGTTWIGVTGGAGLPTGDYSDVANTGWHLGATGTHQIDDMWGIGADIGYHAWSAADDVNDAAELLYGAGSEINFSAIQATAHGVMNFTTQSNLKPYAKVGVGIYNVAAKLETPTGDSDDSESKLGFNFGGGMNFLTKSNMRWGVAGAFHIVPAEDDLGSDMNFFELGLNVVWGMKH